MSRIGKKLVPVPDKVEVKITGLHVSVKGPKGLLEYDFPEGVEFKQANKEIEVSVATPQKANLWGLSRTLLNNMLVGVTTGFTKELEFNGVGYKAQAKGDTLNLSLGYSHPIDYKLPKGITVAVKGNRIEVTGADKQLVGHAASIIRGFRPPEPYKGKGIKYVEETILRKAGKTGAKK